MSRRTLQRAPNPHQAPPLAIATRRDLFGTMGAMLLLSAAEAGSAKAAELDGELLACCAEITEFDRESERLLAALPAGASSKHPAWMAYDQYEASVLGRWAEALDRIVALPARTPEGLRAKAAIAQSIVPDSWRDNPGPLDELAMSIFADVAGRAQA